MKKIIIKILIIFLSILLIFGLYKIYNNNKQKKEIKILLQAPDSNKNEEIKIDSNNRVDYTINSDNTNSTNINNKELKVSDQKSDTSKDFISGIKKDTNKSYAIKNEVKNEDKINNIKDKDNSINISNLNNSENNINNNDSILLAHLIESEAGDQPYQGKLAVASVVLNRTKVDNKTIKEVIYSKSQFSGVQTNNFNIQPSNDSINAANEILKGKNTEPNAYFFADLNLCSPSFAKNTTFIEKIGEHWFFKK